MCTECLRIAYRGFVNRTNDRSAFVEQAIAMDGTPTELTADEKRNDKQTHTALFGDKCRGTVQELLRSAISELRTLPFERSDDVLTGVTFVQELVATALWKYQCNVGSFLESFAREFDRLDVDEEKMRFYRTAQQRQAWS